MQKWALVLLLLLLPGAASGGLYQCMKDGKATYQDRPCDNASTQTKINEKAGDSLAGCYEADFSRQGKPETFEVRRGETGYEWHNLPSSQWQPGIPLIRATPEDVQRVSRDMQLDLREGMRWVGGSQEARDHFSERPVGLYRGRDQKGNDNLYACLYLAPPTVARKIPCPVRH